MYSSELLVLPAYEADLLAYKVLYYPAACLLFSFS